MVFLLSRLRRAGRREPSPELPQPTIAREELQIDRKILEDPSACLDSEVEDPPPRGLTPSTRLPSAGGGSNTRYRTKPTLDPPPVAHLQSSPSSSVDISPRAYISGIAPLGWSTFGRSRKRACPLDNPEETSRPPSTKDSKHFSTDSILSTFSLGRLTHPSRTSAGAHDKTPSPSNRSPQPSPNIQFSSEQSSPTNTMSSKRHPRTPQRPSSYIAPTSVTNLMTSVPASDSPHTFGQPTPPDKPAKFSVSHPPPPPLPPLDHPELASALPLHTDPMPVDQPTSHTLHDRSNTLPTKRRTPRKDDILFPSLSLRLSRSVRRQPSPVRAKQVSSTATSEQQETRPPNKRRRARTVSGGAHRRRTSADWNSHQASVGVTSHANQAWPAEVSREILRLSLSGQEVSQGSSTTRGRNTDPAHRTDQGVSSPSFLPFPHPPRPSSSAPLRASVTLTDGRETASSFPRPHSLQFNPGNGRGSKLPERSTMTEVKRSLSAIETRMTASGAHYASSGLTDPAPTSSGAPHASLAPTPSRSLFSGQVSRLNAHAPPSSFMQGEPSTPTPEPRHLSDKSRGKRKAEDTLDVTPPEQKKEGQRATFLLPSESRSQRVSNSSHAPSSYHRKRARLSSTSPFATPVQSRPTSIHETPRSANRSHHFTSLSSSTGAPFASRTPSRAASTRSRQPPTPSSSRKHERRQSISQVSIPISAYIAPHAPSIGRSTKFHMRDPRKPPKKPGDTPWGLRFATEDEPGSPIQAWCFFLGFLLFPIWWIAALFLRIPRTRIAGDVDAEKGVTIDDPQIEHDAKIWRFRCRVMAAISLFTYIPFIVLVAIFAPR